MQHSHFLFHYSAVGVKERQFFQVDQVFPILGIVLLITIIRYFKKNKEQA